MSAEADNSVERGWARLGVLLNCEPAPRTPDPERLLLATAAALEQNARLGPLVVTWLVQYGHFVARHRLKRLIQGELDASAQPALGLLLASAIRAGATRELDVARQACRPATAAHPLYAVQRSSPELGRIARRTASALSRRWGVWSPPLDPRPDAIRPGEWLLARNPDLRDRIIRKGDLRCSILETLRRDVPGGQVQSESELARLCAANRTAVRKALAALVLEGEVTVADNPANQRDHPVRLRRAA